MQWNLEGLKVEGYYLNEVKVIGKVESSRVKYGGMVQHTVILDEPIQLKWRNEPTDRVLLDHSYVTKVMSN